MGYRIAFKKSVDRDLKKIEEDLPAKADVLPSLTGKFAGLKQYRVGDYRVIFSIISDTVLILRISH